MEAHTADTLENFLAGDDIVAKEGSPLPHRSHPVRANMARCNNNRMYTSDENDGSLTDNTWKKIKQSLYREDEVDRRVS
jgi:hypothetical protein